MAAARQRVATQPRVADPVAHLPTQQLPPTITPGEEVHVQHDRTTAEVVARQRVATGREAQVTNATKPPQPIALPPNAGGARHSTPLPRYALSTEEVRERLGTFPVTLGQASAGVRKAVAIPDAATAHKLLRQTRERMGAAYASSTEMFSVWARARLFHLEVQKHIPNTSPETSFLMWLEEGVRSGNIRPQSASQYITYYEATKTPPEAAYRRAMTRFIREWNDRVARGRTLPELQAIREVVERGLDADGLPQDELIAALATQWATAARGVDIERLAVNHILTDSHRPDEVLVVMVGGKTDPTHRGQPVPIPRSGLFTRVLMKWRDHRIARGYRRMFDFNRSTYNAFLRQNFDITSHGIRHATLTAVARSWGQTGSQAAGRHKQGKSTQHYIPMTEWAETEAARRPMASLQQPSQPDPRPPGLAAAWPPPHGRPSFAHRSQKRKAGH